MITGHSTTLNDNIFSNEMLTEATCRNLTNTIFDHLLNLLNMPSIYSDPF